MFYVLLISTFAISFLVSFIIAKIFDKSIKRILNRIISEEISSSWHKYIIFAVYVVGVSGGVNIWKLENYINPPKDDQVTYILTTERWVLEIYRTILESLQSIAWMLLLFFIFSLIAYVIIRIFEHNKNQKELLKKECNQEKK
ncbi:MAG: hypothetical protein PVH88_26335 [Ignavibacteria bacterium]|jgi:hypothetical protein